MLDLYHKVPLTVKLVILVNQCHEAVFFNSIPMNLDLIFLFVSLRNMMLVRHLAVTKFQAVIIYQHRKKKKTKGHPQSELFPEFICSVHKIRYICQ